MADLRARLERLGERASPRPDAFERLERRRRRRDRNRRLGAGMLALVLVVGGSLAAFTAFRGDGGTVGGVETEEGFFALWPEQTTERLAEAQALADSGDPDFAWRSDPHKVAGRFARETLLWPAANVSATEGSDLETDDVIVLQIEVPPEASCDQIVADAACPNRPLTLTIERLGRADGLWSIVEVHGDDLALPLVPGQEVVAGTTIAVPTDLADGEKVSMGIALLSACDALGADQNAEAAGGVLEFHVPDVPDGCTGYVYAMRPKTDVGAVAIGSFVFTDAEAVPGIGYLVQEVSAVPVRFVNDEPSTVAEFACDGTGRISSSRSAVIAQPDGVHVAIANTGDVPVSFSIGGLGGDGAEPGGRTEAVWDLPPGDVEVSCSAISDGGTGVTGSASVTVVDPNGYYASAELHCSDVVGMSPEYPEGWLGYRGDPVEAARVLLTGLLAGDVVERAGYPESSEPIVRIVRDGAVVGRVWLFPDTQGGWLLDSLDRCDEPGISFGWGDEAAKPYPRGWFEWCPAPPFGEPGLQWRERASEAAVRFVEAYMSGDEATLDEVLDPSVPPRTEFPQVVVAEGVQPAVGATNARGGGLVDFSCGRDVDAYTVAITLDDGTESASADFTVFLVLREGGWRVWGAY